MAKPSAKKKKGFQSNTLYKVSGDKMERKNKNCPKCGPGMFMANHKDRDACGKCGYTQFRK